MRMAPGRGATIATDADEVQPSAKVCINGLKNATQLNGQRGIILSKQDERWAVKLDASGERVLVRGANLKVRVEYQPVLQGCGTEKANSDGAGTSRDGADPTSKLPAGSERLPRFNAHKPLVPQIIGLRKQVRIGVPALTPIFQSLTHHSAHKRPWLVHLHHQEQHFLHELQASSLFCVLVEAHVANTTCTGGVRGLRDRGGSGHCALWCLSPINATTHMAAPSAPALIHVHVHSNYLCARTPTSTCAWSSAS